MPVPRRRRFGLLILALVGAAGCLALGWWQWSRWESNSGSFQNLGYALQWPLYGFMGLWFYVRMCREELNRDPDEDEPGTDVVLYQRPRIDTSGDPELASYNAYLAELNERALQQRAEHGR